MKIEQIYIHNYRSIKDSIIRMQDYSLLVGENNVGKSNIIDAIRCFYDEIKFENSDLCNYRDSEDSVSWIEMCFILTQEEYDDLKDEYKIENCKLKVRKFLTSYQSCKPAIYGYTKDGLESTPFYGAKNVQQGKFGKIVYIPAILDVKENVKLTGSSSLRNLLEIAFNSTLEKDVNYQEFSDSINKLTGSMKNQKDGALFTLENNINQEIDDWGIKINFSLKTPTASDLLKNMLDYNMKDDAQDVSLEKLGTGFQRHFIYNLIKLSTNYIAPKEKDGKDFTPNMTLLLFEEPEVFLHPSAQEILSLYLRKFSTQSTNQVLVSTHSSQFVSMNIIDINTIIRLEKNNGITNIFQTSLSSKEVEECKNLVFFDRPRSDLFFAKKVILVEGPTEYMLFNYFKQKNRINIETTNGVACIDTIGKLSMPYFIKILKNFNIRYSALFDLDSDINRDDNQKILTEFNSLNDYHYAFPKDIETFCQIEKKGNHVLNILRKIESGEISSEKQDELIVIFQDLISKMQG